MKRFRSWSKMNLVQRLGLTRNEGLYFVFSSAKFYVEGVSAKNILESDSVRNTWVGRSVGLKVQDILNDVAEESINGAGCSGQELGQDYIDSIRQQITVERRR